MNQSQLSYINEVLDILEVPVTYKCPYCKNLVTQTYQGKACKACLLAEFKRLRPLQDFVIGNRYISNPDESSTTISASLPAGRELFEIQDTLELVEPATPITPLAKGGLGGITPWSQTLHVINLSKEV